MYIDLYKILFVIVCFVEIILNFVDYIYAKHLAGVLGNRSNSNSNAIIVRIIQGFVLANGWIDSVFGSHIMIMALNWNMEIKYSLREHALFKYT